ncbi:MAG: autotransporter domain-containing protein [Rhizobiaceae bacterium]
MYSRFSTGKLRPFIRTRLLMTTFLAGFAGLSGSAAFGQVVNWIGTTSDDWLEASNWENLMLPDITSDVVISGTDNRILLSVKGEVEINGLVVGDTGDATLRIEKDSRLITHGYSPNVPGLFSSIIVGQNAGSKGTINVVAGSEFDITNEIDLVVGDFGKGRLQVANNGRVSSRNGIIGADAGFDYFGVDGRGDGAAVVKGRGSRWDMTGSIWVGDRGDGSLVITGRGTVTAQDRVFVGNKREAPITNNEGPSATGNANGFVLVSGRDSTLTIGNELQVGVRGNGTLTVANGGLVSVNGGVGKVYLARFKDSNGTINIGASWNAQALAPGVLSAASIDFGIGSADNPVTLAFNHTDLAGSYEFAPNLVSAHTPLNSHLILHQAGYTNLNGNASAFEGTARVNGGTLAINNIFGGSVDVANGGTLGGTGHLLGDVTILSGGSLSPGRAIGEITIADLVLSVGSNFKVDVDEYGASDLVSVTNSFQFDGGTVFVSGIAAPGHTYTILRAPSIAIPSPVDVQDTLLVDYSLSTDGTALLLRADPTGASISDVTSTPMARRVMQSMSTETEVYDSLYGITTVQQMDRAMQLLSGEIYASFQSIMMDESGQKADTIYDRFQFLSARRGEVANSMDFANRAASIRPNGWWTSAYREQGSSNNSTPSSRLDNELDGILIGLDEKFTNGWNAGVAGGYSANVATQHATLSKAESKNWTFGAYGGGETKAISLRFGAFFNRHSIDTERAVALGTSLQNLSGTYDGISMQSFGEVSYKLQLTPNIRLEPFAGYNRVNLETAAFTETGGSAALTVAANSQNVSFTTLGLRNAFSSGGINVRAMVGWRQAFGDLTPTTTNSMSGGTAFVMTGTAVDQNAAIIKLGFDAAVSETVNFTTNFTGDIGTESSNHGISAQLTGEF